MIAAEKWVISDRNDRKDPENGRNDGLAQLAMLARERRRLARLAVSPLLFFAVASRGRSTAVQHRQQSKDAN